MGPPTDSTTEAGAPPVLVRAIRHLLRPLVRVLLAHQITYPLFTRLLKNLYLEVADRELSLEGRPQTASRLSLLTGIHRKDIRSFRSAAEPGYAPSTTVSLGARLAARWTGSPEFTDADGAPLALPRLGTEAPSFELLVASVSTDIRSRAVLDEWLRLGVVEHDTSTDLVRLVSSAFVPSHGFDEKVHFFGRNLHDHIAAGAHNLADGEPPLLERSVYYDGLSEASVRELRELAERAGMDALQAVNRRAQELQRRDAEAEEQHLRMTFGAYFFRARTDEEPGRNEGDDEA